MTRSEVRVPHRPPLCGVFCFIKIRVAKGDDRHYTLITGKGVISLLYIKLRRMYNIFIKVKVKK